MKQKGITILAIETSCDDTGIAVIKTSGMKKPCFKILSNIVSSQVKIHQKYGGVYPALAKREHQKNLVPVLKKALKEAGTLKELRIKNQELRTSVKNKKLEKILIRERELYQKLEKFFKKYRKPKVDAIAVTVGPGLEPCLWVGVNFAKALSYYWKIPIISINHIKAHIFVNVLTGFKNRQQLTIGDFPAVCLIVSGGHTQLFLMENFGKYKMLGETRDDAAGECFDKTARVLGLGYPGGPAIAAEAAKTKVQGSKFKVKLPRPMIYTKDYDFSFSGLKTAVLYAVKKKYGKAPLRSAFSRTTEGRQYIKQMCVEIQQAIIDVLIKKTIKAVKNYKAKTLLLGGGVIANKELRKQLKEKIKKERLSLECLIPDIKHCTDNAVMVGIAGYFRWRNGKIDNWEKIKAEANLRIHPVK